MRPPGLGRAMPNRLQDRIAVVTGSDSGIGRATAIEFAKEGADVAVTYHTDEEGAEGTKQAVEEHGQRAFVSQLDQSDPEDVRRLFDEVNETLGRPTILVNNAGIDASGVPVKDMDDETWDRAMKVNLYGPFYCSREFLQGMEDTDERGDIINISSIHEDVPRAGAADYDVAKGGLRGLTRTLALELATENVHANSIAPGMVLTPFNQPALDDPEVREKQEQSIPVKRAAEPEEIAPAAVFLASPEADYIQGETLTVDGALQHYQAQGA